jgi:WD40 repeat protein
VTAKLEGHGNRINALCALSDGRLASASSDRTIRMWDVAASVEIARLEVDANAVTCLAAYLPSQFVAGDGIGRLHWLEIVD